MNIQYRVNTASAESIRVHLEQCENDFHPPLGGRVNIAEYANKLAGQSDTFEAWEEEHLLGLVAAYFNHGPEKNAYVSNVSTLGAAKGKGIGSQLMRMCIKSARDLDLREIRLEVGTANTNAIGLYEKFGFRFLEQSGEASQMILDLA